MNICQTPLLKHRRLRNSNLGAFWITFSNFFTLQRFRPLSKALTLSRVKKHFTLTTSVVAGRSLNYCIILHKFAMVLFKFAWVESNLDVLNTKT